MYLDSEPRGSHLAIKLLTRSLLGELLSQQSSLTLATVVQDTWHLGEISRMSAVQKTVYISNRSYPTLGANLLNSLTQLGMVERGATTMKGPHTPISYLE